MSLNKYIRGYKEADGMLERERRVEV